ncbi:MAG: gephyrin-like molybdotransferase Glp [Planctomycetota bacterium]
MKTPAEALAEVLGRVAATSNSTQVPLEQALRRVLARDVASDVDLPPFEKSAMDGFAVRSADFAGRARPVRLRKIGESRAGAPFEREVRAGECTEITTGSELPRGCDAVVMVEKTRAEDADVLLDDEPRPGQNVCHRGEDLRAGEVVLRRGARLAAVELAVLASVGCDPVPVHAQPRVSILATGDELVAPSSKPGIGQIREGNSFYLAARAREAGAAVSRIGIVPDDPRELERVLRSALEESDVVITTGGVSMGRYDLVGGVLERCGVEPVFHKVAIKPGKPLWFGMRGARPVFGLPGNPVSCLIGFEVFIRPALAKLEGEVEANIVPPLRRGRWKGGPTRENPREQHLPVKTVPGEDGVVALEPIRWSSSADITGLTRADALALVPMGRVLAPGELVLYRPLR